MQLGGAQGCTRWHTGNVYVLRTPIETKYESQHIQDIEEVYMTPARDPKLGFVCYHDLGGIWEPFGIHLETAGGVEAEEASGGQISNYVPHSAAECKSSIKILISRGVLRVPSIMTAYLQSDMSGGFWADPAYRSRALYQHRENPTS